MSAAGAVAQAIVRARLLAIVRADRPAAELAQALLDAGVAAVELSLVGAGALDVVADWRARFPGLIVGAGTVLTAEQARSAVDAGAQFLISPGIAQEAGAVAREREVLHVPAAITPSELVACMDAGAELIKLFPAAPLGIAYMRQLFGPFPGLRLVPTGGIDASNARAYLDAGASAVAVGSSLVGPGATYETVHSAARELLAALATNQGES